MTKLKKKTKKIIKSLCKPIIRSIFSEDFVCKQNYESFIKQRNLRERVQNGDFLDLLTTVHIETRTRCNSSCAYCAANPRFDRRDDRSMSKDTYQKIINGLAEINYSQRVSPYCNNEPLLDKNIYSYIAYAREKLPDATIELKTNGTVLNEDRLKQLFENGLDKLYINDYQVSSHASAKLEALYDAYKNTYQDKLSYSRANYDNQAYKLNRAGSNPSKSALPEPKNYFCYRPFEMIVFTADGKMACCSNDFYLENNIGNIHNASLKELFTGERIQALRKCLMKHDRSSFEACRKCDYVGLSVRHDYSSLFKFFLPLYT